jgi:hypothetical protein
MPSYRVVMTLGRIHPGANAARVLPDAVDAVAELTIVEAKSVGVVKGQGTATVRFLADDDDVARQIAEAAAHAAGGVAEILMLDLRRQNGTRWPLV